MCLFISEIQIFSQILQRCFPEENQLNHIFISSLNVVLISILTNSTRFVSLTFLTTKGGGRIDAGIEQEKNQ